MVPWYDPPELAFTASRVILSKIFGEYADPRQAQVASRPFNPDQLDSIYQYDADGKFWFDFVADLGDGWNPTAAIAQLLAKDRLVFEGEAFERGRFLIMGGDQVYPQASRDEYRHRLIAPYECALPEHSVDPEPHLYAIPGNHDWYDGLNAFLGLFCSRRTTPWGTVELGRLIGAWRTQQTRSYFALSLPHGWWLWGVDTQLGGYIDRGQLEYFTCVAERFMRPGSQRVLLVAPNSTWLEVEKSGPAVSRNLMFVKKLIEDRGHQLRVVLAGNIHNFTCYRGDGVFYIGSGGGGAYCDATHLDPPTIRLPSPSALDSPEIELVRAIEPFPSVADSRRRGLRALLFPLFNPIMTGCMALIWAAFAWTLDVAARNAGARLADGLVAGEIYRSPLAIIMILLTFAGTIGFADSSGLRKWSLGIAHGAAQTALLLAAPALLAKYFDSTAMLLATSGVIGGIAGAFAFGAYLWLAMSFANAHADHAFSSFRLQDFKHFMRVMIDADGTLWLFPIGLRRVPRKWRFEATAPGIWVSHPEDPQPPELLGRIGPVA